MNKLDHFFNKNTFFDKPTNNQKVKLLANHRYICLDNPLVYGIPKDSATGDIQAFDSTKIDIRNIFIPYVKFNRTNDSKFKALSYVSFIAKDKYSRTLPDPVLRINLDFDFGQVLGILCGDGWVNHDKLHSTSVLNVADLNGDNANYVINFFNRILSKDCHVKKVDCIKTSEDDGRFGNSAKYSIGLGFPYGFEIIKFIAHNLGGAKTENSTGAMSKHLPQWFDSAPIEFQLGLLNGLISTDGTLSKTSTDRLVIIFGSTSRTLIDQVKVLCKNLKINSLETSSKKTVKDNLFYAISLSSLDCKVNNTFANIALKLKRDNFTNTYISTTLSSKKFDNVPLYKGVVDKLKLITSSPKITKKIRDLRYATNVSSEVRKTALYAVKRNVISNMLYKCIKNNTFISRYVVNCIFNFANDDYAKSLALFNQARELLATLRNNILSCEGKNRHVAFTRDNNLLLRKAIMAFVRFKNDKQVESARNCCAILTKPTRDGEIGLLTLNKVNDWLVEQSFNYKCWQDEFPELLDFYNKYVMNDTIDWTLVI